MNKEINPWINRYTLIISTMIALIAFVFKIFQWSLVDTLTVFILPLFQLAIGIITLVCIIVLICKCIKTFKNRFDKKNIPLYVITVILILIFILPIDMYSERVRLAIYSNRFNEAAVFVLENNETGRNIALPEEFKHLSRGGGEVQVAGEDDTRIVLFYTFRGILDNYSVYAYVPNERAYQTLIDYENWKQIVKIRDNWYFCVSY